MLFTAKPLIVVAFALKQLLKVRLAVKFTVQCGITAQAAEAENSWVSLGQGWRAGWGGGQVKWAGQGRT